MEEKSRQILYLISACQEGNFETVKSLVTEDLRLVVSLNNLPVRFASESGHLEIVKFLVENKADITALDNNALQWTSFQGHLEVVKFLVENKADIAAENNKAVQFASENDNLETVKFLLSKGADFSKLTPEHKTYFRTLKVFRRWRFVIFLRRLNQIALPLYYSPGFPGFLKGKNRLSEFVGGMEGGNSSENL